MAEGALSTVAGFCVVSATLTAALCCCAAAFGRATRLIDKPDGIRKLHKADTPLVGGLALMAPCFALSLVYFGFFANAPAIVVAIMAASLTLVLGVIDDRSGISPVWRLLALTFIIFIVFAVDPEYVLHTVRIGIFHSAISFRLDPVAAPVIAFVILGFVNAANMADGMNGQLLGSIIIWCGFISYYMGFEVGLPYVALIFSGIVVLIFNLRGQLFSGSSGAYAAALFIALGAIAAFRSAHGALPTEVPMFWFWLPVLDCLRLMVSRTMAGRSPFSGDRNHFHHMLLKHMRTRYALLIYLVLLAAPGVAVIAAGMQIGSAVLLACMSGYAIFVAVELMRDGRTPRAAPATRKARQKNLAGVAMQFLAPR